MEGQLKWVLAAGLFGMVGYAVYQFAAEAGRLKGAAARPRQPWERY
jgi:hypothetical protein